MQPKWYDGWFLSISGVSGGGCYVKVELPNYPKQPVTYIAGNVAEIKKLANLLDKLLCELTGTETQEMKHNGYGPAKPLR